MAGHGWMNSVPEEKLVRARAEGMHLGIQSDARIRDIGQPERRGRGDDFIHYSEHVDTRDLHSQACSQALKGQLQQSVEFPGEESSRALRARTLKSDRRRQSDVRCVRHEEMARACRVEGEQVVANRKKRRLHDG